MSSLKIIVSWIIKSIIGSIITVLFFVSWGFIYFAFYVHTLPTPPPLIATEGLVVFSGEYGRIQEALSIYHKISPTPRLLISGTYVAALSRDPLVTQDLASTTKGNVAATSSWTKNYGITSLRLVTSDYHLPRCLLEMRGWKGALIAHPLRFYKSGRLGRMFREYIKFLCVYFCHNK